jgi:hypothetical protein
VEGERQRWGERKRLQNICERDAKEGEKERLERERKTGWRGREREVREGEKERLE